jgi:hypothetical protein
MQTDDCLNDVNQLSTETDQAHCVWRPAIVARKRIAMRAVKAAGRAQRGRSGFEDERSALSARVASRTIIARRPEILTWMYERSTPRSWANSTTTSSC